MMTKPDVSDLHRLVKSVAFPELGATFWKAGPGRTFTTIRTFLKRQESLGAIQIEDVDRGAEVFLVCEQWRAAKRNSVTEAPALLGPVRCGIAAKRIPSQTPQLNKPSSVY
jgi:hypothetical protein